MTTDSWMIISSMDAEQSCWLFCKVYPICTPYTCCHFTFFNLLLAVLVAGRCVTATQADASFFPTTSSPTWHSTVVKFLCAARITKLDVQVRFLFSKFLRGKWTWTLFDCSQLPCSPPPLLSSWQSLFIHPTREHTPVAARLHDRYLSHIKPLSKKKSTKKHHCVHEIKMWLSKRGLFRTETGWRWRSIVVIDPVGFRPSPSPHTHIHELLLNSNIRTTK